MGGKIRVSIIVDRDLWEKFKERVVSELGPRQLSRAVEEAIREELVEIMLLSEIEEELPENDAPRQALHKA